MLPERLKQLRKEHKLTQKELAAKLGMDTSSICKYESGKALPSHEVTENLANVFNVSIDYLYGRKEETDDDEVNEMLERLKSEPNYRVLLSKLRNATPEEINQLIKIHAAIKATNNDF